MRSVAILQLPYRSESIHYIPVLEETSRGNLLQWYARLFKYHYPDIQLLILCPPWLENRVREAINGLETLLVCQSSSRLKFTAIHDACAALSPNTISLVDPAMAFGPSDLLARALSHHEQYHNDLTRVTGFPRGATPEVYSFALVRLLHLQTVIQKRRAALLLQAMLSSRSLVLEDGAAKRPIIAHELNALASYGSDHCDFPEEINSDDISFSQIAEAVMQSWSPAFHTSGSLDGFRAWKRELLMRSQDLRANLSSRTQRRRTPDHIPRQKIRVAYAQGAAGFAGAEEALSRLIAHLDRDVISPHAVVSAPGWFSERLRSAGAQVTVSYQDLGTPSESALDCILGIFQKLEPDIVHLNTCKDRTIALAATLLNIPVVMHARVHEQLYNGNALGLASSVIAISSLTKRTLQRHLVDPQLVSLIYDGMDLDYFDAHKVVPFSKRELGINNDFHIIVMIARYVPYKRHDLMLDALELLLEKVPNVCLVLVGDVFREEEALLQLAVKERIAARGLSEHVRMIGFQHDIRRIEAAATALVLCSDGEPFGICVSEAMALGIPVIVTETCGVAEVIQHGVDGYIVPSGSPAAITAAFEQILTADNSMAISHASRSAVAGKLSLSDAASRIVAVYKTLYRQHASDTA